MQLTYDETEISDVNRSILEFSFASFCSSLEISSFPDTVVLDIAEPMVEAGNMGHVSLEIVDGKIDMKVEKGPICHVVGIMAHEMVHVKQLLKKELVVSNDKRTLVHRGLPWTREMVNLMSALVPQSLSIPWEIEAHSMAPVIVSRMIDELDDERRVVFFSSMLDVSNYASTLIHRAIKAEAEPEKILVPR